MVHAARVSLNFGSKAAVMAAALLAAWFVPTYFATLIIGEFGTLVSDLQTVAFTSTEGLNLDPMIRVVMFIAIWAAVAMFIVMIGSAISKSIQLSEKRKASVRDTAKDSGRGSQDVLNERWTAALALHDRIDARWHGYETDLDAILSRPLMRNLSEPSVAAAVRARSEATNLREESAPRLRKGQHISDVADYLNAVSSYEHALEAAEQLAQSRGLEDYSSTEQSDIKTARRLLALAMDPAAPEAEKQTAYDRVRTILDRLTRLQIPKEAMQRVELDAGVTSRGALEA